jgi:dolichyl-phosphate-mannose-protein mannosyltransferase
MDRIDLSDMPSTARRETGFVAAMTFVGAVLRFWGSGHLGLNHFDEGIYAIASTWSSSPKGLASISPELIAYAPPLYPILVGVAYLFLGVSDISAILVSQVCGILTIPAVAWVARRTFGPGAGAAAAALVAISGPHIAFSRMALTDPAFLLCWVLALGCGGRFLERPGAVRAVLFGLMVGLAQNAKYNGYLAGGIVALAALLGLIRKPGDGVRVMGYGLIAALVAGLVYVPWYRFVESHPGGYAGLMKHHRSYLSGPSAWPTHWRLQMAQSFALSGELARGVTQGLTWGIVAWPVAWIGGTFAGWRGHGPRSAQVRRRMGFVLGSAVYGVAPNLGWWVALAMLPWWVASKSPARRLLAIGWVSMAILTPFYHPYARLWLPLHAFGWMALASLVVPEDRETAPPWSRILRIASLATAILAAVLSAAVLDPRARSVGSPIGPTDSLRTEIAGLATQIRTQSLLDPSRKRILAVARPTVLFYLMPQCDLPIVRFGDVNSLTRASGPGDSALLERDVILQGGGLDDLVKFQDRLLNTALMGRTFAILWDDPPTTSLDRDPSAAIEFQKENYGSISYYPNLVR